MRTNRAGFTLVELLIVIVIIGMLLALLVPVLGQARHTANIAAAKSELSQLEMGIAGFSTKYGSDFPSEMKLFEVPSDWNLPANIRYKAAIRRIWPQFNFDAVRDINRDGDFTDTLDLDGSECLVFFLGGLRKADPTLPLGEGALDGFSPDPANPLMDTSASLNPPRRIKMFEFNPARLVDPDGDGMPSYRGRFNTGSPIVYYSAYEGRGYRPTELVFGMTDFYRRSPSTPFNPNSYQLIDPGFDGLLGTGGLYDPQRPDAGLGGRPEERDNLTNFASGVLAR